MPKIQIYSSVNWFEKLYKGMEIQIDNYVFHEDKDIWLLKNYCEFKDDYEIKEINNHKKDYILTTTFIKYKPKPNSSQIIRGKFPELKKLINEKRKSYRKYV